MKNKNGFTLVELMAVVVILIIILLLALNKVRKSSQETKMNAAKANTLSYIKAIDDYAGLDVLVNKELKSGIFSETAFKKFNIKLSGQSPNNSLFCLENYKVKSACVEFSPYKVLYENGEVTEISDGLCGSVEELNCNIQPLATYDYIGNYQSFVVPKDGTYRIELWGAQGGGTDSSPGGKGGYTSGYLELRKDDILYFYVGEKGKSSNSVTNSGAYNGGGYSGDNGASYSYGGGGATDVRLVSGAWNNEVGLRSRIMVAGGGGGNISVSANYSVVPGVGGNLTGGNAEGTYGDTKPTGGTQTGPGATNTDGKKGVFGAGRQNNVSGFGGGGGGGYWGGSMGNGHGGSGGSSYISGYLGAVAVASSSTNNALTGCNNGTTNILCSIHYSGYIFNDPIMKSGSQTMPTHDGTSTMTGNEGNGYAKVFGNINIDVNSDNNVFAYKNGESVFNVPETGKYKLEVWGAQGGSISSYTGGYGSYSRAEINLSKGDTLYINVGGQGVSSCTDATLGGYNGGGNGKGGDCSTYTNRCGASGGGATSIALKSGELKSFNETTDKDKVIIVAGGGGGAFSIDNWYTGNGGHAGGTTGLSGAYNRYEVSQDKVRIPTGGSQSNGGIGGSNYDIAVLNESNNGSFGLGGSAPAWNCGEGAGGGGGFYGGGGGYSASGGGGSGYISNSRLLNAEMYCYNCTPGTDTPKSTSTTCVSQMPSENCAKIGDGIALIKKM